MKSAKKLKNKKRQINENLIKNKENTSGNEKQMNEKIENDHSRKDPTETIQENVDKNTQERDVNNNKKEEEMLSTNPVIEPITENDYNELCESLNEHSETVDKNIENPHQKINNNDDTTGVNNKATQEIINDNKPIIILEHTNKNPEPVNKKLRETKNTKTPEGEATAGDTMENQPDGPVPTEMTDFQEMMVKCMREQFPQTIKNSFEKAREEMINDIRPVSYTHLHDQKDDKTSVMTARLVIIIRLP